jgi:hypothetical protein
MKPWLRHGKRLRVFDLVLKLARREPLALPVLSRASGNSLIVFWKFLVLLTNFPVPIFRELAGKLRNHRPLRPSENGNHPEIAKFPVLFPVSREFRPRDGFDIDCVRHHALFRKRAVPKMR